MTKEELFALMKGTIIVSCQATPGEPLYDKERSVMPLDGARGQTGGREDDPHQLRARYCGY